MLCPLFANTFEGAVDHTSVIESGVSISFHSLVTGGDVTDSKALSKRQANKASA